MSDEELRRAMREGAKNSEELRCRIGRVFAPLVAETHEAWLRCQEGDLEMMIPPEELRGFSVLREKFGDDLEAAAERYAVEMDEERCEVGEFFRPIVAETHESWLRCQEEDQEDPSE